MLFGGATGDTGRYSMTGETFIFNIITKTWAKLTGKFTKFYGYTLITSNNTQSSRKLETHHFLLFNS